MNEDIIPDLVRFDARIFPTDKWEEYHLEQKWPSIKPFILQLNGRIVGYCLVLTSNLPDEAVIDGVAVTGELRRQGLGELLLRLALNWIEEVSPDAQIIAQIRLDNTTSRHLFRKLGFKKVEIRDDYYRDGASALVVSRRA